MPRLRKFEVYYSRPHPDQPGVTRVDRVMRELKAVDEKEAYRLALEATGRDPDTIIVKEVV